MSVRGRLTSCSELRRCRRCVNGLRITSRFPCSRDRRVNLPGVPSGRALFHAASLAALVSGCSLITSLDGLTNGDDVALTPGQDGGDGGSGGSHEAGALKDAAPPSNDGAIADDTSIPNGDATPDDASSVIDTGPPPDAPGTDAGPLGFCGSLSPSPLFCDDFDESSTFGKWDSTGTTHGIATIGSAVARSAPNGATATSNPLTTSVADVTIAKAFPTLTSTPRVETLAFDMFVEKMDTTHGAVAVVGALMLQDSAKALHEFQFVLTQTNGKIVATFPEYWDPGNGGATGFAEHDVSATVSLQTWIRVTIQLSLFNGTGTGSAARLFFDGTVVALLAPNLITKNGAPQALLGLSYVQAPSDAWVVHYDNATFDTSP